jgi:hypothetical protein
MRTRSACSALLLVLAALLVAACGSTDDASDSADGSIPLEQTDDSLGPPLEPSTAGDGTATSAPETSTTAADDGGGPQASAEVCEQLLSTAQPTPEQVELFPEDLQDDATEYVEAIQQYIEASEEAAANGGVDEGGQPDEVPPMSDELASFLSSCQ